MMFRALSFVIIALLIAYAASWLSAQDGTTTITWLGYRAEIESSALIVALFGFCVLAICLDRLVRALFRWPSLFSAGWQARRKAKGETALSLGFVALAAGDHRSARKQAKRAEKLLENGILTDLLVAQSSYAGGDSKAASRYFKKLASEPKTAYFGQLGLMRLHQQSDKDKGQIGISKEAFHAARKAFALDSTSAEAAQVILRDALDKKQWETARDCLSVYLNHSGGQSEAEVKKAYHLHACLLLQMAEEATAAGGDNGQSEALRAAQLSKKALKTAISYCEQALQDCPDFTPASEKLVSLLRLTGDKKAAQKQAVTAFTLRPHKMSLINLAQTRDDNDGQFISYAMRLAAKSEQADEAYLAVAQFAIQAGIWASASQALSHISESFVPHNEYYRLVAAIANGLEDETAEHEALEQAAQAPRAASWSCTSCHSLSSDYQFECPSCGSYGQIAFTASGNYNSQGNR